jgi:hypothetical protein
MNEHHDHDLHGGCFCGAVRYKLSAPAQFTMVCHCSICRRLQASAMGAPATFFPADALEITSGEQHVREFLSPRNYSRMFCDQCGTRLWMGFDKCDLQIPMVAVYTTNLDDVRHSDGLHGAYDPAQHVFYADRLYDCLDGKPKFVDMATDFGGSGQMMSDRGELLPAA